MRKLYLYAMCMLGAVSCFAQQTAYSGRMLITPRSFHQKGDSVYVDLKFDLSSVHVHSRHSIGLVPALVAQTDRLDLTEVVVKGRENYQLYQREISLMSKHGKAAYAQKAPYAVVPGFKSRPAKTIDYTVAVKFEPWMAHAKLELHEDQCGCGSLAQSIATTTLAGAITREEAPVLDPYVIVPALAYIQPATEPVKRREMTSEAFLDFAVGNTTIRPDYMNNPRELKKITDLITELNDDQTVTVRAIHVIGYASPEGTMAGNKQLSEQRAKALVEYLLPRFNYSRQLYDVAFGGENWIGLKALVEASQMPYRQEVLHIIESVPEEINYVTQTSRKKSLMSLSAGEPFRYMLHAFFPSLRKAVCKIDFDVKNFDVDQAKEVVKHRPQNLSLNEIFLVAGTYEKGSLEFIDLFETAVRLFPDDTTANLNAATAALSRGDVEYANRYLSKIKPTSNLPEYYNTLGVMELLRQNYGQAKEYLDKAARMGSEEAVHNLKQIVKLQEHILLPENRK